MLSPYCPDITGNNSGTQTVKFERVEQHDFRLHFAKIKAWWLENASIIVQGSKEYDQNVTANSKSLGLQMINQYECVMLYIRLFK